MVTGRVRNILRKGGDNHTRGETQACQQCIQPIPFLPYPRLSHQAHLGVVAAIVSALARAPQPLARRLVVLITPLAAAAAAVALVLALLQLQALLQKLGLEGD
jgi:hypothetical protein